MFNFLGSFLPSVKNNKSSTKFIAVIILPFGVGDSEPIVSTSYSSYVTSFSLTLCLKFKTLGALKTKTTPSLASC